MSGVMVFEKMTDLSQKSESGVGKVIFLCNNTIWCVLFRIKLEKAREM